MFTETARAKINLNLHVGKRVDDPARKYFGYHPLSSLVVFADYGDELSCEETANETSLKISGPFADGLDVGASNLVLKAYQAVSEKCDLPHLSFQLTKNLPVASGIGGGSADAAAALRLMGRFVDLTEPQWLEIALSLGADVPVCYHSKTCIMSGIGQDISFLEPGGSMAAVLVNPGSPVSTAEVFQHFAKEGSGNIGPQKSGDLLERFAMSHNDLQYAACQINPDVTACLDALRDYPARMSGSGATCFALTPDFDQAVRLATKLKDRYSNWWVQTVMLGEAA